MTFTVAVVGAGVIGLTTGIRLAERGLRVHVYAAAGSQSTVSAAAGAIWDPKYARHPRVPRWARLTHEELVRENAECVPGIRLVTGIEAARRPMEAPASARLLPDFSECASDELPDGFVSGWRYTAPIIDMPRYLGYLRDRLQRAHGRITERRLSSLNEDLGASVVVNCSGLGARELVPDPSVEGIRGQLVAVRNPGVGEFFIELTELDGESTYFLPQGDVLLLGGTADPEDVDPHADLERAERIVQRCAEIYPVLADAPIIEYRVGIRPSRPAIRLERVTRGDRQIVHNYGHGGSGVSLCWGCADDVAEMVLRIAGK